MIQREIILNLLKDNKDWTVSYDLIKVNTKYGWLGSGSDRIARYLVEDGDIERKQDGKYAYYRIKQENRLFDIPEISQKDLLKFS